MRPLAALQYGFDSMGLPEIVAVTMARNLRSQAVVRRIDIPVSAYSGHVSEMPISEATGHLDEVADESAATGEVIYLTRDGRRLAAIVPADAAAEMEAAEDAADIAAAEAAMAEPGENIPASVVWAELSLADDE
jgi:antitoxin (DNA-binding transcriptional repressor) of toxin-antitoxin stability system